MLLSRRVYCGTVATGSTAAFFGYLLHVDLTVLARPIRWGSFFAGLLDGPHAGRSLRKRIFNQQFRRTP